MPNFRSVSLLVWPGDVTQTNKYTNKYIHTKKDNLRISSTGCSRHIDFDTPAISFKSPDKFWHIFIYCYIPSLPVGNLQIKLYTYFTGIE